MSDDTNETLNNVLGSRARSRTNSTATVITGDIVTSEVEETEKDHTSEAQD